MNGATDELGLLRRFRSIRIINLPERADRRAEIGEELARIGLSLNDPAVRLFPAVRPTGLAGFPTIGARGCFLSHLGVLREALTEDAEAVLILEDDAGFATRAIGRAKGVLAALDGADWGLFFGGSDVTGAAVGGLVEAAPDQPVGLTHFVAVRRDAIRRLVPFLEAMEAREPGSAEGGPMHVDGAYTWFRRANPDVRTFGAAPPIAHQRASRTDVHALGWSDRLPGLRHAREVYRRIRRRRQRAG